MGGGLSLRLAPPLSACSPSGVMTKKPLEPASAEAYPTSTSSAASLSLNALSSGFPSGSRPAPSATLEIIAGFPSSAPPPRSLSVHRNFSRSSSNFSGNPLAKICTSWYRSLPDRIRANASSCSVPIVRTPGVGFLQVSPVESSSRTQQTARCRLTPPSQRRQYVLGAAVLAFWEPRAQLADDRAWHTVALEPSEQLPLRAGELHALQVPTHLGGQSLPQEIYGPSPPPGRSLASLYRGALTPIPLQRVRGGWSPGRSYHAATRL